MALDVVGHNVYRVDGYSKVTGKAVYPQDIFMDGMLFGKTLRSTVAHAKISVDTSNAEAIKGVVKILTAKDTPGNNRHGVCFQDQEVFCATKVKRVGDPIAFVIAETEQIAHDAIKAIKVAYEELAAVFDPEEALLEGSPKIHDDRENLLYHYKCRKGNIDEGFKKSRFIVENVFHTPMVDHAFLQPESGIAYLEKNGTVVVCCASQCPHNDRAAIAEVLGIPKEKVKVLNYTIGGAFGGREDLTLQAHVAIGAVLTGRPVKCTYSREESFAAHPKKHPIKINFKLGADTDGKLTALEAKLVSDSGAYASWSVNVMRKAGIVITGPYQIENVKIDSIAVYTNNPYTGAMRGFGATQAYIATEQSMDMLAEKIGISPLEIRLKNAFRVGSETANGQLLSESTPAIKCINAVAGRLDNGRANSEGKRRGIGLASTFYGTGYGNGSPDISNAISELRRDGKVALYVGAIELGQGTKTVLCQIAAEVLGLGTENIILINEDTDSSPDAGAAVASRQTYNTGNAIKRASEYLKEEIASIAKEKLQLGTSTSLEFKDGYVFLKTMPQKRILIKEIAATIAGEIRKEATFMAQTASIDPETGQGAPFWPYTYSACSVEVEVDLETGRVDVIRGVHAQDVGRAINPALIEGQMDGGFVMAMGYVLHEELKLKEGKILNNNFTDYLVPTAADIADLKDIIIEDPESTAPFGAKGMAEPAMLPVGPAILNAIYNATGVRLNTIPVTPERLLRAINKK